MTNPLDPRPEPPSDGGTDPLRPAESGAEPASPRAQPTSRRVEPSGPGTDGWDQQVWRRPSWTEEPPAPSAPADAVYTGPPRSEAPDATWRPPTFIEVPPARELPHQDDVVIDAQEQQARTVTYGVGLVTGAVALIVLLILCGRVLF
ncbi:MAG TPA: translation initiation factor 2 [Micromonosporaceae bacterium]|nr:translation initiation factor 2 [Micromonosporaceae bacterium]